MEEKITVSLKRGEEIVDCECIFIMKFVRILEEFSKKII